MQLEKKIEIHGHRGARGLYPENTITGFFEAVKTGVDFIEMDVVVSKDNQLVVSHEPWMNPDFCFLPDGQKIKSSGREYNLYKMNYSEIVEFDCGKGGNKNFPLQACLMEHKPLLAEVVHAVDAYTKTQGLAGIKYNIEIKSEQEHDDVFQPAPKFFSELVYNEIKKLNIQSRCILQSFDVRILQELKKTNIQIPLSLLVENEQGLEYNLKQLGFTPEIYAPEFQLIDKNLVETLSSKKIKLITWTVNEIGDMKKMIELGVKGIITDYPDRLVKLIQETN